MSNYEQRTKKIIARINELALLTEEPGMITRTYGSPAFVDAANTVKNWMINAGLETRIDNIGNVRGKLRSDEPNAKTLIIASHIDSVVNAGKWDGPLGVVMGLDAIEHLAQNKAQLPFHIELIAYCDEEGVRFHSTYLGSKVVAGSFDVSLLERKDKDGITLEQAIKQLGGNVELLASDALLPEEIIGYFEIHIEQGPVLYEADLPVAVVTGIAGQRRIELVFKGEAGHAGTVPMDMRQDALCCAAECITEIEAFAVSHKKDIVATVGKLDILNAASNVIPGLVKCSLDVRSADDVRLTFACNALKNIITTNCDERSIVSEWNIIQETSAVVCDKALTGYLNTAMKEAGYPVIELVSGAGHDAVPMSQVCPVSMMFVRCYKGISHNPLEDVEAKDIAAAVAVTDRFIQIMTQNFNQL